MQNKKLIYGILLALLAVSLILGVVICLSKNQDLKVVFFDVGQGDAILISQGSSQLLVDSGKSGQILLEKLGKHVPFWDRKIESIVITHPDHDHIGGFADVFKSYEIGTIIKTNVHSDSQTFKALEELIEKEGSDIVEGKKGVKIIFPNGAEMEIIHPFSSVTENSNDINGTSVVAILKNQNFRFLLTGDLTAEKEKEILEKEIDIAADVLKIAHHGSKYSTGEEFLRDVSPADAIISAGRNNSYGHPAPEVLDKLKNKSVKIIRTSEAGDIVYTCKASAEKCLWVAN